MFWSATNFYYGKMKPDSYLLSSFKIGIIIFIPLAIIISLFPPFEFGNEKLRTLSERKINSKIVGILPIKEYDFIFNSNKKYFALDSTIFYKLFAIDSVEFYKEKWNDKKFQFDHSIDSFFTAKGFLYPTFLKERYNNGVRKLNVNLNYKDYGLVNIRYRLDEMPKNYSINYDEVFKNQVLSPQQQWMLNHQEKFITDKMKRTDPSIEDADFIKDAVNYWDVRSEYNKEPFYWNWSIFFHFDSSAKYDAYNITQPVYYLLDRKLLISELLINHLLAFFVTIGIGLLFVKIKKK